MPQCMCGGQRTTCGESVLSTMWVLGMEFRLSGVEAVVSVPAEVQIWFRGWLRPFGGIFLLFSWIRNWQRLSLGLQSG